MVFVESVYWGDDLATRNITKSFVESQVKNGRVDTVADERLIPAFESNPEVKLETQDEKEIRDQAVRICGEANQSCLNAKMSQLRQERLHEKEKIANSTANTIKGRRLTVNLVDKDGKRKTVVVPDGQKVELDGVDAGNAGPSGKFSLPKLERVQGRAMDLATIVGITALQVFGIAMFIVLLRDNFANVWMMVRSTWLTFGMFVIFVGIPMIAIPWLAPGLVIGYYLFAGFWNEVRKDSSSQ